MDYLKSFTSPLLPQSIKNQINFKSKSLFKWEVDHHLIDKNVNGADICDLPIEYEIKGILTNELPVIGTYVDPKILPGFKYRIRRLLPNTQEPYIFNGDARYLTSVGTGYAKRLTFDGASLSNNKNFFWSDNCIGGYAFSLLSIEVGQTFTIYASYSLNNPYLEPLNLVQSEHKNYFHNDDRQPIGDATVTAIYDDALEENSTHIYSNCISKHVSVKFDCDIKFDILLFNFPLKNSSYTVEGNAILTKNKDKGALAELQKITDITIPHIGKCKFLRS